MICKIKPVTSGLTEKAKRTMLFAARDLARYLKLADPCGDFPVIPAETYKEGDDHALYLVVGHAELPEVEDAYLDDAIFIRTKGIAGVISGTNARAVLIGAYRFLRENGYAFTKPGKYGETIPEVLECRDLSICEAASYRHRAICIEGATYQECLFDMIDFMPKVGLNGYFIQFLEPDAFFNNYYLAKGMRMTQAEIASAANLFRDEIFKRSMLYHAVGHGWTCQTMGCDVNGWDEYTGEMTEEDISMLALVNGKRELFKGRPLHTNLCYSQQKVRDKMNKMIVDYIKEHPDVDYLHYWLADDGNNVCECEDCASERLADTYVRMLNELDEMLTAEGLDTKIVYLIYNGLIWAPLKEKFKNSKRFVLMLAPGSRVFTEPLDPANVNTEIPPYAHNNLPSIRGSAVWPALLKEWQDAAEGGDSFDFDYHLIWGHPADPSTLRLSKVMSQDIKNYEALGLNGIVSCQAQRVFLPTSATTNVMAETLWNKDADYDDILHRLFKTDFGKDYQIVWDYLKSLQDTNAEELFNRINPEGWEDNLPDWRTEEKRAELTKTMAVIDAFRDKYGYMAETGETKNIRHNWKGVLFYGEMLKAYAGYYMVDTEEEIEAAGREVYRLAKEEMSEFRTEFEQVPARLKGRDDGVQIEIGPAMA